MPFQKLQFRPGVVKDVTGYTNEGGWRLSNLVRFRFGYPQSIGGWSKYVSTSFLGSCRALINWVTLSSQNLLGVGTNLKYYLVRGGEYFDITPLRITVTLSGPFTATTGSPTIAVYDVAHGCVNGDFVTFSGATSLGGNITAAVLNKEYEITYIDADNYTITASVSASASDTGHGGSSVSAAYQINTGLDTQVGGTGWGAGTFSTLLTYTLTNPLTTSSTSPIVTVAHTSHGLATGNYVAITSASAIGGIPAASLQSTFPVTVINANSYTITTVTNATSIVAGGGGSVVLIYPNGSRAWGSATTVSVGNSLRLWAQDNYGENLVFNIRNGGVYYWQANTGLTSRGVLLSSLSSDLQTPDIATQVLVSDRDRHIIALGANYGQGGSQDPLIIRFSSQEDPYTWTAQATNTAGDLRLGSGSAIIRGVETKREIMVFTDTAAYSMQYVGPPYTFGIQQIATGINVAGFNAFATVDDTVFWMGKNSFYVYSGKVDPLPCPLQNHVFTNFNITQGDKVYAAVNTEFSEITWFYPSLSAEDNDVYVTFNYLEKVWTYGTMARTAWIDSGVNQYPIAASVDNYLYNHEIGTDDGSTNPASPLNAYLESSPMDLGEGEKFSFVRRVIPDVTFVNATNTPRLDMTLKTQNYPGSNYADDVASPVIRTATVPVEQYTEVENVRLRGRSVVLRIESNRVGTRWVLGSPRLEIQTDGRR